MSQIDYLVIGHVAQDLTPSGPRLGGTVTFSALTARALGLRVGIVTSLPEREAAFLLPLGDIPVSIVPAEAFTTFTNTYTEQGRQQILSAQASRLVYDAIPAGWRDANIVHIGPIAQEIEPELIGRFPASCVCVTPQGWMRQWDAQGRVSYLPLDAPIDVVARAGAVVLSIEDVQNRQADAEALAAAVPVLVVTRGRGGCTLYLNGQPHGIPAPPVREMDPTGAGDIFATAFFTRFCASGDALLAAQFATLLASASVTRPGLRGIPNADAIRTAEKQFTSS